MASAPPPKEPSPPELRPFRILFIGVVLIGLGVALLSQWKVLGRPMAIQGPLGVGLAFHRVIYFDQVEYFDTDRHFFFTRLEGDSFNLPQRVSGDLWCGTGNADSMILVFRSSFSIFKKTEDGRDLRWSFAGKIPTTWPTVAILPTEKGYRGIGYKRLAGRGELRCIEIENLEAKEQAPTLPLVGDLLSVSAVQRGDTTLVAYTLAVDDQASSYLTRYTASGFGESVKLPIGAEAQALVLVPSDTGAASAAPESEPPQLFWLAWEKDSNPGEVSRYRWDGLAMQRMAPLSPDKGWLSENVVEGITLIPTEKGVFAAFLGDDIVYAWLNSKDLSLIAEPKPLLSKALPGSGERGILSYLVPVAISLVILGLFSRQRSPRSEASVRDRDRDFDDDDDDEPLPRPKPRPRPPETADTASGGSATGSADKPKESES